MFNPKISFIPEAVCMQEYTRVVPFLKDTLMARPSHVNVGTIGHVDHGRSAVASCVSGALGTTPVPTEVIFTPYSPERRNPVLIHASELDNLRELVSTGASVGFDWRVPVE